MKRIIISVAVICLSALISLSHTAEILKITHEAGDLSEWDSTIVGDGGAIAADASSKLGGTGFGLHATTTGTAAGVYAYKDFADLTGGANFRVRFYYDPNGDNEAINLGIFYATCSDRRAPTGIWHVVIHYDEGRYRIKAGVRDDVGWKETSYYDVTDEPHYLEFRVQKATSSTAADGEIELLVDGESKQVRSDLDLWDYWGLGYVAMGIYEGPDANVDIFMDELVVRDDDVPIGPVSAASARKQIPAGAFSFSVAGRGVIYTSPDRAIMDVKIFDLSGNLVKDIPVVHGSAAWNGRDRGGKAVSKGVYFIRINGEKKSRFLKFALLG